MKKYATAFAICFPLTLQAASIGGDTPPKQTKTTTECVEGQIFDQEKNECVDAQESFLLDEERMKAVRELSYAGKYDRALLVLASVTQQVSSSVMTYRGFIARKQGQMARAFDYYDRALELDADNVLARSYLGQAKLKVGNKADAEIQLAEILARGGTGTWAEKSLDQALRGGVLFDY